MATPAVSKKFIHTIEIPVTATDGLEFRAGWKKKSHEMYTVICKVFPPFTKINHHYLGELVKNSYDSKIASGLEIGDTLNLKVVIKQTDSGVIVKFKDDGSGFVTRSKGSLFLYDREIDCTEKEHNKGQMGGMRIGLEDYINEVKKYANGDVMIKNRKEKGVSIQASFPGSCEINTIESYEFNIPDYSRSTNDLSESSSGSSDDYKSAFSIESGTT